MDDNTCFIYCSLLSIAFNIFTPRSGISSITSIVIVHNDLPNSLKLEIIVLVYKSIIVLRFLNECLFIVCLWHRTHVMNGKVTWNIWGIHPKTLNPNWFAFVSVTFGGPNVLLLQQNQKKLIKKNLIIRRYLKVD